MKYWRGWSIQKGTPNSNRNGCRIQTRVFRYPHINFLFCICSHIDFGYILPSIAPLEGMLPSLGHKVLVRLVCASTPIVRMRVLQAQMYISLCMYLHLSVEMSIQKECLQPCNLHRVHMYDDFQEASLFLWRQKDLHFYFEETVLFS